MINKNKTFQQGQTLPLTLILLAIVASTVFFMFNSGQLVQEKMRLTNTADAVAYSAGVYEARVLNYDAYTNRALIANEIAIGQAVGLASWAKYAGVSADNVSTYARWIPYFGPYLEQALQTIKDTMDSIITPLSYSVNLHDLAIKALKVSEQTVHGPGNSVALINRKVVMDEVARQNDPDVVVDLLPVADNFAGFTKYYKEGDRARMRDLVVKSRDAFLKSRNWSLNVLTCPARLSFKKRGATELIGFDGWKSMDTFSVWYPRPKWYNPCRQKERPIGYGSAFSEDHLNDSPTGAKYGGSTRTNPRASALANSIYGQADGLNPSDLPGAIPEFYDLSVDALTQPDPRTYMTIRVTKVKSKQHYSGGNSIIKPTGQLDAYRSAIPKTTDVTGIGYDQNVSAAMAKVEVFFERPDGANNVANGSNKNEIGSLFNPYWQVHLAPVSVAERTAALLLQQ